ncbi:dUTP diphosphatase [Salinicoccus roseus]|uniref:dUTP diphosphatase n=1 Tax=Salinicoccus roseus TaxID=45670 RepID=UPI002300C705|nr:dUTP diphosphatase [Salinicoccus roseus]
MTLTLSKDTIQWLLEAQERFDNKMRADKGISDNQWDFYLDGNHKLALKVELHEFVNECHDLWKYWKSKPINRERILDEAIDVIHFVMLLTNKREKAHKQGRFEGLVNQDIELNKDYPVFQNLLLLSDMKKGVPNTLALLLIILDHYGFTEQDIIEQYKRKNAINFERLEEGY